VRKTTPCSKLFVSQICLLHGVCVCLCEESAPYLHGTFTITKNLSASISTFSHLSFYRSQSATLCAAPMLYNPHSALLLRGLVQPRLSPPAILSRSRRNLIATNL
jgi:hypothetical protein